MGWTAKEGFFVRVLGTKPTGLWRNLSLLKAKGVVWADVAHKWLANFFMGYLIYTTDPVVNDGVRAIMPSVVKGC